MRTERGLEPVSPLTHPLSFAVRVPAHPLSVGFVRRAVNALEDICGPDAAERLTVIFSELVTNAIRHASNRSPGEIEAQLVIKPNGSVRGTVRDAGSGFDPDRLHRPQPDEIGGFGLYIVGQLVSRWGVSASAGGTEVWFEL